MESTRSLAQVIMEMRDEIKKLEAENRELRGNAIMTVRRYSTSSNLSGMMARDGRADKARQSNSAWGRLQEEIQPESDMFDDSDKREAEKVTNRHSLQEYVHKNAKVKSVSFLLPVDDIYTNRPVLTKHLEEPKITGLTSISETDS
uniref:Uncharacterized LOC108243509 n=1 Tax=Kryptolebias marmoratus TaxID=37003 RepID=A0A3Q3A896_KRYMA